MFKHAPEATATDFFCGMGGSSTGLVRAGFEVKVAANHWDRAITTHSANHPTTENLCADISAIDLRYLPRTQILWASPICTEISPAGGTKNRSAQKDLFEDYGHVPTAAFERTRVTFWEVIRAAEIFRYPIVIIENVVEAAAWELFDTWLAGMSALGYEPQFVSVSAAHIGDDTNPHAPQWRDRLYIVLHLKGVRRPDVEPRPAAWCQHCSHDVPALQWWKRPGRRIGKYGAQYIYVCPEGGHGRVEPYVAPASTAIDWTNLGTRIGDRIKKLAPSTMLRIRTGLDMLEAGAFSFTTSPTETMTTPEKFVMSINHAGTDPRAFDPDTRPMPAETAKRGEALLVAAAGNTYDAASKGETAGYVRAWPAAGAPMPGQATTAQQALVTMLRANGRTRSTDEPLPTFSTGRNHGLTIPPGSFITKNHAGYATGGSHLNKPVTDPIATMRASGTHSLVIPFRKGSKPYPADADPLSTMATRDQHAILQPHIDVDDCYFRMLQPREAANAQAFPQDYIIHGNQGEQQMQAGNAAPVNVAAWLGAAARAALNAPLVNR